MKKIFAILLILSTIISNAQDSTFVKKWANGEKGIEYHYKDGKKHGEWRNWNNKGELTFLGIYQVGNLVSKITYDYYTDTKYHLYEQKIFNTNSTLIEYRKYSRDNKNTYTISSYYDTGKKKSSGRVENGKKDGKWKFYKEDGSLDKSEKISVEKINRNYNPKKDKYTKGYYIHTNGERIEGYFKYRVFLGLNLMSKKHEKLKFKLQPNHKPKVLPLKNVVKFNFEEEDYIVITSIRLKGCHVIGKGYYKNKIVKVLILGRINLYSAITYCQTGGATGVNGMMMPNTGVNINYSTEVFIIQKSKLGIYEEVRVGNKKFRALIKKLVSDNTKMTEKLNFEDLKYNDLRKIIEDYNSKYE